MLCFRWFKFYWLLINNDTKALNQISEDYEFYKKKDFMGVRPQEWHNFIFSSQNSLKSPSFYCNTNDQLVHLDAQHCHNQFNFKLLSSNFMTSFRFAQFTIQYIRVLRFFGWRGFSQSDSSASFANQIEAHSSFLAVYFLSQARGYGVFAAHDIAIDQAVTEYLGVLQLRHITNPTENSAYTMQYPLPGCMGMKWTLNAYKKGNIARFVNHSRLPNLKTAVFYDGILLRIALVSQRPIQVGEELTLDYGSSYWLAREESL